MIRRPSPASSFGATSIRRFLGNPRVHFFTSPEGIVVVIVILLLTSGLTQYAVNRPEGPSFSVDAISFQLGTNQRTIDVDVKVNRGTVELKQFFLNNATVYSWTANKHIIKEGDSARCVLEYPWKMNEHYTIRAVVMDGGYAELTAEAPRVIAAMNVVASDPSLNVSDGLSKVNLTCSVDAIGVDDLHLLLFTYTAFQHVDRPVYVFYDPDYMPDESLKRADAILGLFRNYNVMISKTNYTTLVELSEASPEIVLILVNPLKDHLGRTIQNAIPAGLVDRDGDSWIRNESTHGRSLLFDWMADKGLVLVTVGSLEPYKRLLHDDGTYSYARDSLGPFDVQLFLTNASGEESILNGSLVLGSYYPPRISGTLGLSYREASVGFDQDAMKRNGLQYYVYGDYKLSLDGATLNLSLPVFIRAGKGGWLAMGDEEHWLSDEQLAHDLFLICVHSVWDSEWDLDGWDWDSGSSFYQSAGRLNVNTTLTSESIPSKSTGDQLAIRIVAIGSFQDAEQGILVERLFKFELP